LTITGESKKTKDGVDVINSSTYRETDRQTDGQATNDSNITLYRNNTSKLRRGAKKQWTFLIIKLVKQIITDAWDFNIGMLNVYDDVILPE